MSLTFKSLRLNIELFCLKPLNLYVRPVSGTFMWNLLALMWNLVSKPSCGTFTRKTLCEAFIRNLHTNLFAKRLCGTFMWNFGNLNLWNLSLEPSNLYLWNLGTCKSGTVMCILGEPEFFRVEPWVTWFQVSGGCPKPPLLLDWKKPLLLFVRWKILAAAGERFFCEPGILTPWRRLVL